MGLPLQDQAVNLKHEEEGGTRNLIQMSGTAPIMTQHHIPEQLKLQQHQCGKSLMSELLLGKLRTSHTKKHSHQSIWSKFCLVPGKFFIRVLKLKQFTNWYTCGTAELLTSTNAIPNYVSTDSINLIRVQSMICDQLKSEVLTAVTNNVKAPSCGKWHHVHWPHTILKSWPTRTTEWFNLFELLWRSKWQKLHLHHFHNLVTVDHLHYVLHICSIFCYIKFFQVLPM
jgi:hypothetical protein